MTAARPKKQPPASQKNNWVPEPDPTPPEVKPVDDNWINRSGTMRCRTCMYFVNMRCRRHAPTMQGYPAVYHSDWCGDHKVSKEQMGGF